MTLVIRTPLRSRPIAASMRSSSCPARPTNGRPIRSSSAPGASPMIMTGAAGLPSVKTVLVAVRFKGQPSNPATSAASASTLAAPETSRRADWSASLSDSVRAGGGAVGTGRGIARGSALAPPGVAPSPGAAQAGPPARTRSPRRPPSRHTSAAARAPPRDHRHSSGQSLIAREQRTPVFMQILYSRFEEIGGRVMGEERAPRERMEYDVVIVGAGPSGLAAAIRLKQLAAAGERDLGVCIVEKGSEVGAHILSGAVFEPRALGELIPDWREQGAPLVTPAAEDRFLLLTKTRSLRLPTPPQMANHGNYIISLGNLCRWLAQQAEALGVEIYPGFAAAEVLYDAAGRVQGVATGDMGIGKDGRPTDRYQPGVELIGRETLFAEGCRGSLP